MAYKRTNASGAALPQDANDLRQIKGIGPAFEKHLQSAGITTFVQLAELTPEAIASLIPNVSAKQIADQNWIHQARSLASDEPPESSEPKNTSSTLAVRQHYENFTIEFLLDGDNKARRIRLMHIQSGDMGTWAKWDANGVVDFLSKHTGADLSYPGTVEAMPVPDASIRPDDRVRLLKWTTILTDTNQPVRILPHGQKFDVMLTLDISNTPLPEESQLDITGTLFAKKLGSGSRQMIGEIQSMVPYSQIIDLTVAKTTLPQGLYRLEAFITLIPSEDYLPVKDSIDVSLQGGLFQVY